MSHQALKQARRKAVAFPKRGKQMPTKKDADQAVDKTAAAAETQCMSPHQSFFKSDMETRVDVALDKQAEDARMERQYNAEIDRRDHRQCRACGKRTDPDVIGLLRGHRAHIVYASAGGSMEPWNRVTLCPACHLAEHKDRLRFTESGGPYVGIDANGPMEFWRKEGRDGDFYLSRRELAPHVVESGGWR